MFVAKSSIAHPCIAQLW